MRNLSIDGFSKVTLLFRGCAKETRRKKSKKLGRGRRAWGAKRHRGACTEKAIRPFFKLDSAKTTKNGIRSGNTCPDSYVKETNTDSRV